MHPLDCELTLWSRNAWIQQVLTGLSILRARGLIRLTQRFLTRRPSPEDPAPRNPGHLRIRLDRRVRLHFDLTDGPAICGASLEQCDLYLKRSFDPAAGYAADPRLRPLGLNYGVYPDGPDLPDLARLLRFTPPAKLPLELARFLDAGNRVFFQPRLRFMEAAPFRTDPGRVVFISRAWDPGIFSDRSDAKAAEIHRLNDFRADCIRLLRAELGDRFLGGFTRTPFETDRYADILFADPKAAQRRQYSEAIRSGTIALSTAGLHGSTPWKMGEYLSLSMAIVSEPLTHRHPGDLAAGRHYLEFKTPPECVAQCSRLLSDPVLHHEMRLENFRYYHRYLRPDMLVLNALLWADLSTASDSP